MNGLPCVTLTHESGASALVYVYAAHLASWTTANGQEQLFVSSGSEYGGGKAIRGGIPICWPQFAGRGSYPKHGICRTNADWKVLRSSSDPFPCVVLTLKDTEATRKSYPFPFTLQYCVSLDGPDSINVSLTAYNPGPEKLDFTCALHTYFGVKDVESCQLEGLKDTKYEDSTKGGAISTQEEEALLIRGEVDRVYLNSPAEVNIVEGERVINVLKAGFPDAVVWNIGAARSSGLKDLGAGEWQRYICYEAGAIGSPVALAPKTSWTAGQTFRRA